MDTNAKIIELLKANTNTIMKIECSDEISDMILNILCEQDLSIAYVLRETHLYEAMRVHEYLKFFASLHNHKELLQEAIQMMHLDDLRHVKTKSLSHAQKIRVSIARCIIQDPDIFYIQEPLKDVDDETCRMILEWLDILPRFHKQAMITSMSLKQLYLINGTTYYMNKKIIELLDHEEKETSVNQEYTLMDKISVKHGDKVLLFNPIDIDYIESMEGKTYVYVRSDSYIYTGTLDEVEIKLKRYGFYRCHRSYLINMQKVSEIIKWTRNSYSLKLETIEDVRIPLSKGRIDEMKELYHL